MQLAPSDPEYEKIKEQLLQTYLATPAGREKLVISTFGPAEEIILQAKDHPEVFTDSTFTAKVLRIVAVMERIQAAMDGSEAYAKVKFDKLFGDLKALHSALPSDDSSDPL